MYPLSIALSIISILVAIPALFISLYVLVIFKIGAKPTTPMVYSDSRDVARELTSIYDLDQGDDTNSLFVPEDDEYEMKIS